MAYREKSTTPVISSELKVARFVAELSARAPCEYRVLGMTSNASLICRLATAGYRVRVGTPGVCPTGDARKRPELALQCALSVAGPASIGGWHPVVDHDLRTYELICSMQWCRSHGGLRPTRSLERLLRRHPAWSALSFPTTGTLTGRARVIEALVDPRWYVDPARMNSVAKLHSYMGLHPDPILLLLGFPGAKFKPTAAFMDRASAVLAAWGAHGRRPDDLSQMKDPRHFLWRIYSDSAVPHRCLRAARRFITFVNQVWLDAITKTSGDGMLDLKQMLRRDCDVAAYKNYLERNDYAGR